MTEENEAVEDAYAGVPKKILESVKALFENLDEQHTGLVHISDIKRRWRDNAIPNLPGVYDSFRFVAPADGLLNFDTFVLGFKTAVKRREKNRILEQSKKTLNSSLSTSRLKDNHMDKPSGNGFAQINNNKENALDFGTTNEKDKQFLQSEIRSQLDVHQKEPKIKSFLKSKHKRSLSGPEVSSLIMNNQLEDKRACYTFNSKLKLKPVTGEQQPEMMYDGEADNELKGKEKSVSRLFSQSVNQDTKHLNDKAKMFGPCKKFFRKAATAQTIFSHAQNGQYGSLKRPAMSTPNKRLFQTRERSEPLNTFPQVGDFNYDVNASSNIRTPINVKENEKNGLMLSEGYEENLNNEITDDVKTKNSTSPLQRNSESPSTSPRQLTTPLPPGRSIERRLENDEPKTIKPKGFLNSIFGQKHFQPSTTVNDYSSLSSQNRKRKSKSKNQRRHTVAGGVDYALLQRIQILNEEEETLSTGLDIIEQVSYRFQRRLQEIELQRRAMDDSISFLDFRTVPMLSVDELGRLSCQVDGLVKFLSGIFETKEKPASRKKEKSFENLLVGRELRNENKKLILEISFQSKKITQLEKEKTQLIQQLFRAKAESQAKPCTASNSTSAI